MKKYKVKTVNKKTIEVEGKLVSDIQTPKITLNQLASMIKNIDKKVDNGFQNINKRIDKLDQRIDNLVKVNNLKE